VSLLYLTATLAEIHGFQFFEPGWTDVLRIIARFVTLKDLRPKLGLILTLGFVETHRLTSVLVMPRELKLEPRLNQIHRFFF
jgi:hypothetical protein